MLLLRLEAISVLMRWEMLGDTELTMRLFGVLSKLGCAVMMLLLLRSILTVECGRVLFAGWLLPGLLWMCNFNIFGKESNWRFITGLCFWINRASLINNLYLVSACAMIFVLSISCCLVGKLLWCVEKCSLIEPL